MSIQPGELSNRKKSFVFTFPTREEELEFMEAVEAYKEISQIPSSLSINDEDDSELCVCPSKQFSFKQTVLIQTSSSHSNKQFSFNTALIQTVLLDVSVRFVLREKGEIVVDRTQKHRGHLDPILRLLVTPHSLALPSDFPTAFPGPNAPRTSADAGSCSGDGRADRRARSGTRTTSTPGGSAASWTRLARRCPSAPARSRRTA